MDPNEALKQLRELVRKIPLDGGQDPDDALRMVELFDGLDQWIMKNGFLPRDWATGDKTS